MAPSTADKGETFLQEELWVGAATKAEAASIATVVAKAMVVIFMFLFCRGKQNALCEQKQPERNVFAFQLSNRRVTYSYALKMAGKMKTWSLERAVVGNSRPHQASST